MRLLQHMSSSLEYGLMDLTHLILYHIVLQTGLHSTQKFYCFIHANFYSSFEIMEGVIIKSTIEDNNQGQVTFLFYTFLGNGVIVIV